MAAEMIRKATIERRLDNAIRIITELLKKEGVESRYLVGYLDALEDVKKDML